MKSKKSLVALVIATATLWCVSLTPASAATDYFYKKGDIDTYAYILSIKGDTVSLNGNTYYAKRYCSRGAKITGTYTSTSFTGTKTITASKYDGIYTVSASVTVPSTSTDRFIKATCLHTVDGWSYTSSSSIQ
jgi:hypothetical protein